MEPYASCSLVALHGPSGDFPLDIPRGSCNILIIHAEDLEKNDSRSIRAVSCMAILCLSHMRRWFLVCCFA